MKKIFQITLCIVLVFIGCKEENNPVDPGNQDPTVKIPESTKIISSSHYSDYFVSISSDSTQFTFSSGITTNYNPKVNDVLYIPTSTGLLRKITSIQQSNNQITISTTQGTFEDAIETGSLSLKRRLGKSQIEKITFLSEGVWLRSELLNKANADTSIKFDFNKIVYDVDGDTTTQNDQVRLIGHFYLMEDILFDIDVRNFKLQYVRYGYEMNNDANLTLKANFNYQIEKSIQIARITFSPIYLQIGPLPVVIIPEIFVNLGIRGYANSSLLTSVDNDLFIEAGIEYKRATGWNTYHNLTNAFEFNPPQITANAGARGYVAPEVSMAVYGVLSAYARGELYGEIQADLFANPWWSLYVGFDLGVGARAKLLGAQLFDYSKNDLIKFRKLIAQASAGSTPPTVTTSSISNITSSSATGGGNVTAQGSSAVTARGVCWSTSQNPTINNSKTNDGTGTGSFTSSITGLSPSTQYYVRAYATNSAGTSYGSQVSFTTSAGGTAPQAPTLSSPSNGATNVSISPTLSWNPSAGATSYNLEVAFNSNFTGYVYTQTTNYTSQQISNLDPSTTYYWRVSATNNYGTSGWSSVWSFTTASGGTTQGLVAYYPFNGNANDESGSGNHATTNTAILTSDRYNQSNSAYTFNGTTRILAPTNNLPIGNSDRTISVWVHSPNFGQGNKMFVGWGTPGSPNLRMSALGIGHSFSTNKKPFFWGWGADLVAVTPLNDNNWNHVACVFNNGVMKIYINGQLDNYTNLTINTPPNTTLHIGWFNSTLSGFNGSIDDIRIYNRALTDSEILGLYNE